MQNKFFLALLMVFVLSAPGMPQQAMGNKWVLAGQSDDLAVYIDSDSAKMVSETASKIWVKVVARSQRYKESLLKFRKQKGMPVDGYQNFAYTLESLEIECSSDQQRSLETADYDMNDHKLSESFPLSNWRHLSPDTMAASIAVALCRQHAVSNTWWWDYPEHQSHDEE